MYIMKIGKRFILYEDSKSYIKCHYLSCGTLYIDELVVYKEFRGKGLGKYLCSLLPVGCLLLASPIPEDDGVVSDFDLVKFYERCGFVLDADKYGNKYMIKVNNV
jgi:GNAT superfamily N-acetyltransferase